jgi:hypothetical protein
MTTRAIDKTERSDNMKGSVFFCRDCNTLFIIGPNNLRYIHQYTCSHCGSRNVEEQGDQYDQVTIDNRGNKVIPLSPTISVNDKYLIAKNETGFVIFPPDGIIGMFDIDSVVGLEVKLEDGTVIGKVARATAVDGQYKIYVYVTFDEKTTREMACDHLPVCMYWARSKGSEKPVICLEKEYYHGTCKWDTRRSKSREQEIRHACDILKSNGIYRVCLDIPGDVDKIIFQGDR